jgi:hypothetical protein
MHCWPPTLFVYHICVPLKHMALCLNFGLHTYAAVVTTTHYNSHQNKRLHIEVSCTFLKAHNACMDVLVQLHPIHIL